MKQEIVEKRGCLVIANLRMSVSAGQRAISPNTQQCWIRSNNLFPLHLRSNSKTTNTVWAHIKHTLLFFHLPRGKFFPPVTNCCQCFPRFVPQVAQPWKVLQELIQTSRLGSLLFQIFFCSVRPTFFRNPGGFFFRCKRSLWQSSLALTQTLFCLEDADGHEFSLT